MFILQPRKLGTRTQRGQSIVIALLVLLLLGLAGALFVTVVARNLVNAAHGARVQTADNYARAGLTYADAQLTSSVDGADWRPPLQYQLAVPPTEARELARYNANLPPLANPQDPDVEYLQAGYARYNTGAGRFLVRVTYTPVVLKDKQGQLYDPLIGLDANGVAIAPVAVPPGKYLKVESIGREGVIDPSDPTTFGNNRSSDRTQAYQVAYVPIGITDYARFETNPDKRSDIANLGVASQFYAQNTDGGIATPGVSDFNAAGSSNGTTTTPPTIQEYPVLTTYGASDAYLQTAKGIVPNPYLGGPLPSTAQGDTVLPGGGSVHSNMPVRFFGTNVIYLNAGTNSPLFQDTAEIGGDLLLDSYDPKAKLDNTTLDTSGTNPVGQQAALILNPTALSDLVGKTSPDKATYITPSNDNQSAGDVNPAFSTQGGLVRDGSMQNDAAGLPRSITRLEPPLLDTQDAASQMPRYRAIAMNSAPRPNLMLNGSAYTPPAGVNPSLYGYGKAIYVNNPNDVQPDSASIGGGSTLTDEWLHRTTASATATNKGGWNGLFYNPPGVSIVLGQELAPPANSTSAGTYGIRLTRTVGDSFVGPDGATPAGPEMDVKYSDLDTDANGVNLDSTDPTGAKSDKDIVIYAEGNVRVRGILSPNEGTSSTAVHIPRHITIVTGGTAYIEGNLLKGDPDSSISVLAHDYVCVNTTQFLAGSNVEDRTDGRQNPDLPQSGDFLDLDDAHSLLQTFSFGLTGAATPSTKYGANNLALYVAAGPASAGQTTADIDIFDSTGASVFTVPQPPPPFVLPFTTQLHTTIDLSGVVNAQLRANPLFNAVGTDTFQLSVSKDPGSYSAGPSGVISQSAQDVALERVAVLPMDIRIEAVLYAQTRSFFVIPGEWFNTNAADNIAEYLSTGTRPDLATTGLSAADMVSLSRFPMYGQPVDLKITISGSVSEAHPADIAAQTAWMQKWGWIPQYHGSLVVGSSGTGSSTQTPEKAGHPVVGQPAPNQPSVGLQIVYDPQAGYPYDPMPAMAGATPYYLRSDKYGRPLPFTPNLPVSMGLLYSGQSGEAPLLQ